MITRPVRAALPHTPLCGWDCETDAMPAQPARLPQFPGGARPPPETARRRAFIRGVALVTIAVTIAYLVWRLTSTIDLSVWWVAIPLLALEMHNAFGLALYTAALWNVDVTPPWRRVERTPYRLAVFIPTYNEPEAVLLPTVAAAVALKPDHETWVLDDGQRPQVEALASELGARYLARADNADAKAGNLNHALQHVDADIIAVLDADHVPTAGFLTNTLGYFDDDRVAVVQTPQDFYNHDSFEHEHAEGDGAFNEEAIFYRVIAPGKNLWGGAFWCGTGALVRTEALRDVGGVATGSVTEDIHTTIRMQRRGWKTVFHNEVLSRGLAPSDAIQYMLQRNRWALGAMHVLRSENPLWAKGLTFGQRLSFMTTLIGWFDSWRILGYMLLPFVVIATGAAPIAAPGALYGPFFITTFVAQFLALRLLARGRYPPLLSLVFEVLRMPAVLPATLALLTGGSATFKVTPKGRAEGGRRRTPVPPLLWLLSFGCVASALWFAATLAGVTPTRYQELPAVIGAAFFNGMNFALLAMAMRRIRAARFAGERRASVRMDVLIRGRFAGEECAVHDLSLTGALVIAPPGTVPDPVDRPTLRVALPDGDVEFACLVQRHLHLEHGEEFGLAFAPGQRAAAARVALALLNGRAPTSEAPTPDRLAA